MIERIRLSIKLARVLHPIRTITWERQARARDWAIAARKAEGTRTVEQYDGLDVSMDLDDIRADLLRISDNLVALSYVAYQLKRTKD